MRDTDVLVEVALLVRSIRWLAQFRDCLTYAERLWIGEAMRDAADELDRGGRIENCYVRDR
jgi:hypothetical protein